MKTGERSTVTHSLEPRSIGQIAIPVHNVSTAIAFYRDILGLKFLFEVPQMDVFDCGGIRLMLAIPSKPEFDHPASVVYLPGGRHSKEL